MNQKPFNIKQTINDFYQHYFPNAYGVLLSGSCLDESFHSKSDIDVIIFSVDGDKSFNEDFDFENLKIQAIIIPLNHLEPLLDSDYNSGFGNQIGMIAKGQVVLDNFSFLENLIDYCKKIYSEGPPTLRTEEFKNMYLNIVQLYQKIHNSNFDDNFFQVPNLIESLSILNLRYHDQWASGRKFLSNQLKKWNNKFYIEIVEATKDYYLNNKTEKLIYLSKNSVESFSDFSEINSNNTGYSEIKDNHLVLQMSVNNSQIYQPQIINFVNTLKEQFKFNFVVYRTFVLSTNKNSFDSIVLILRKDKSTLDKINLLIPAILSENEFNVLRKLAYPLNVNIKLGFGNNFTLVEHFFEEFSMLINKKFPAITESEKIITSLDIMLMIGKLNFQEESSYLEFIEHLYEIWLPKSYDNGNLYSFFQLQKAKEDTQYHFKESLKTNFVQIASMFNSILKWEKDAFLILPSKINKHLPRQLFNNIEINPEYPNNGICDADFFSPKSNLNLLKNIIERTLEILYIEDSKKSYVCFILAELMKNNRGNQLHSKNIK